jgi:transposase
MPVPRPKGSADLLSDRRRRALALLKSGLSLNEVARRIQCVASSVMRWRNAWRRWGAGALKVRSSPGRPQKLKVAHQRRLLRLLLKGPLAQGYSTNVWTTARIAEVIRCEFRVSYHQDHIGRLMHNLNWSHQKPKKRALERNEAAIEHWKRKDWPRVKKTLCGWVPTSSLPTNPDSC